MCRAKEFILQSYRDLYKWLHDSFFVSAAVLHFSGLLFSYKLVDKVVVSVFVVYLMDIAGVSRTYKAAMLSILQDFIGALFTIFAALISDSSIGIFKLIIFSSAAYAMGLWYLFLAGRLMLSFPQMGIKIFVVAQLPVIVPIAFAAGGKYSILEPFLREQLKKKEEEQVNDDTMDNRQNFWLYLASIFGGLVALFIPTDNWDTTFLISAIAITTSYILFLLGIKRYRRTPPVEKPYVQVLKVFKAAISKWHLEYPREPAQVHRNFTNKLPLGPRLPFFRWLDKAAVIESPEEEGNRTRPCAASEVMEVKFLLKVLPLWTSLLIYYLAYEVVAIPFFYISSNCYETTSKGIILSWVSLEVIRKSSSQSASFLYDLLMIKRQTSSSKELRAIKIQIGIGVLSHILCYFIAWKVEAHRLEEQRQLSIAWLFFQFLVVGVGEGLVIDGFKNLILLQCRLHLHNIPQDAGRRYKFLLRFCVMFSSSGFAFANLLGIVYVAASVRFTGILHSRNTGRCEDINFIKYYKVLLVLSLPISIVCCGIVFSLYRTDEEIADQRQNVQEDTNVLVEPE